MPRPTYLLRVLLFLTTFNNVLAQLNGTQLIADTETGTPALSANCSDPFTGRANKCVAELKISQYIAGWLATHECYRGEAFSTCFLRQNDLSALDCESITSSSCTPPEAGPLVDPQVYYTSYNIYALNQFFKTWYTAVGDASNASEDYIGQILLLINNATAVSFQPDLSSKLGSTSQEIRSNLNRTATSILANYTEFTAFIEQGNFSEKVLSLPSATNYLTYAFNTFLVSYGLVRNNIYATIGKGTNVADLASNGTQLAYPLRCDAGDQQGVCDAWWYSENFKSSFGLVSRDTPNMNYGNILTQLFANLTTGELLFDSAYACNSQGNLDAPLNVTVSPTGVNTACFSQLDVYEWDMACHANPSAPGDIDYRCELLGGAKKEKVGRQKGFWEPSATVTGARTVPAAYLGPAIAQSVFKITRE